METPHTTEKSTENETNTQMEDLKLKKRKKPLQTIGTGDWVFSVLGARIKENTKV